MPVCESWEEEQAINQVVEVRNIGWLVKCRIARIQIEISQIQEDQFLILAHQQNLLSLRGFGVLGFWGFGEVSGK